MVQEIQSFNIRISLCQSFSIVSTENMQNLNQSFSFVMLNLVISAFVEFGISTTNSFLMTVNLLKARPLRVPTPEGQTLDPRQSHFVQ